MIGNVRFLLRRMCLIGLLAVNPELQLAAQNASSGGGNSQPPTSNASKKTGSSTTTKSTGNKGGGSPQTPAPTAQQAAAQTALTNQLTASVLQQQPQLGADYIPCKFTIAELKSLQTPEIALTLSEADGESLKEHVIATAYSESIDANAAGIDLVTFVNDIGRETFAGLTPSQALNRVIADLQHAKQVWVENYQQPASAAEVAQQINAAKSIAGSAAAPVLDELYSTAPQSLSGRKIPRYQLNESLADMAKQSKDSATAVASAVTAITQSATKPQAQDLSAIVDVARKAIAGLVRPADVGCAMSIMSWTEVDHAYGHLIADEYITVQVVVRNLNRDQEFVLHDVEFEVNADPTGRIGRFYSGRDKIVVRALSSAQSSFDPRNLTVHSAQGVAAILSALVPIYGGAIGDAAAVFNAAFVPSLDKYWKDLSTDQLNLLNDTGFSSASSSQMVVPKGGTVMFVTFIPAKQFQEGWWTQPCVEVEFVGHRDKNGQIRLAGGSTSKSQSTSDSGVLTDVSSPSLGAQAIGPSSQAGSGSVASSHSPTTPGSNYGGIDVRRAMEVCTQATDPFPKAKRKAWNWSSPPETTVVEISSPDEKNSDPPSDNGKSTVPSSPSANSSGQNSAATQVDIFRNVHPIPYKKWSPTSLAIFRELSNTVVAGMHIVVDQALQPVISQLKCTTDDKGNLVFPTPAKDTVTCSVTGKNLDKIAKLRLRNAQDAADTTTVEGAVTVSGDSTNASVAFSTASLHALTNPSYLVFAVSSNGVEQKTSQSIHLDTGPFVSDVSPTKLDLSSQSPQTLTISGNHLSTIKSLTLSDNSASASFDVALVPVPTDTQIAFSIDAKAMSKFGVGPATLAVSLVDKDKKSISFSKTLQFTGPAAPAAAPAKKPAAGKKGAPPATPAKNAPAVPANPGTKSPAAPGE